MLDRYTIVHHGDKSGDFMCVMEDLRKVPSTHLRVVSFMNLLHRLFAPSYCFENPLLPILLQRKVDIILGIVIFVFFVIFAIIVISGSFTYRANSINITERGLQFFRVRSVFTMIFDLVHHVSQCLSSTENAFCGVFHEFLLRAPMFHKAVVLSGGKLVACV